VIAAAPRHRGGVVVEVVVSHTTRTRRPISGEFRAVDDGDPVPDLKGHGWTTTPELVGGNHNR
jgi:hypothetical protein